MLVIAEESWERTFKAVSESSLKLIVICLSRKLAAGISFRSKYIREFADRYLIFQCLPIAACALFERPYGSGVIVVISSLRSPTEDQTRLLNDIGVPAIAITDSEDNKLIQQVLTSGNYVLFYGPPEC